MLHCYDDEDNAPMTEDAFNGYHNPTVYTSAAEMNWVESGKWEEYLEAMETAKEIRQSQIWEGFLDDLEIPRGGACRECPWMKEAILEQFDHEADDDGILPPYVYDLAHLMCAVCEKHKNDTEDERYDALQAFFAEVDENGIPDT